MKKISVIVAILFLISLIACQQQKSVESEIEAIGRTAQLPYLFKDDMGSLYLSYVEDSIVDTITYSSVKFVKKSIGQEWSAPNTIVQDADWFVNWADYPVLSTAGGQQFISHYLPRSGEGTYSYDIAITTSQDAGIKWTTPVLLHDDGKEAEHGFVSVAPYQRGYFISWLDGRNTVATEEHHDHQGAMTLRAAALNASGEKLQEWELDKRVCDCCQTSVAITSNGPVVVYRDRSVDEIRDIYITRCIDSTWTIPQAVYPDQWEIQGCPVNGPRVVARDNNLAVAWFTAAKTSEVKVAFSSDGGASFDSPILLNKNETIGRVDVSWIDRQHVFVSWMEGAAIYGAKVNREGVVKRQFLANSSPIRSSGFPQIESVEGKIILAWTDTEKAVIRVKEIIL